MSLIQPNHLSLNPMFFIISIMASCSMVSNALAKSNLSKTIGCLEFLTLIYIFERPRQTVLDGPSFEKSVLITVNQLKDNPLEAVSKQFRDQL